MPKAVVHSFSVGLKGSPDLKFAREVAAHIGTQHHEFILTVEDGLNALSDVIYHLETFGPFVPAPPLCVDFECA